MRQSLSPALFTLLKTSCPRVLLLLLLLLLSSLVCHV